MEQVEEEEKEEVDTEPKKLEWVLSKELKLAVVRLALSSLLSFPALDLLSALTHLMMALHVQRFAETRLSDLICQNEAIALEFEGYGKNAITRSSFSPLPVFPLLPFSSR